jgi:hypothetical protein
VNESSFRDPKTIAWDFRAEGYGWDENTWARIKLIEEFKLEVIDGKLMYDDTMRLLLMGLPIENVGLDKLVRLGDPEALKKAVGKLD